MNEYYATEAWVLGARVWGEADCLLTFFTKDFGRVDAVAKSARLSSSKLRGHIQLFSRLRIMIVPGKEYWRLIDAEASPPTSMNYPLVYDFCEFARSLLGGSLPNVELWALCEMLPTLKNFADLARLKIEALRAFGMLPPEDDCQQFFTEHICRFISGKAGADFFAKEDERRAFTQGVGRILASNHVV